ncbi:hypothetical protein [Larkinella rosea]|uniref:hypothetical protein n=1 Tax=Larkinella rosea TaxID=2025312 RepID=UPI001E458B96|nr:hypothetical protein [Larkinella rosea]
MSWIVWSADQPDRFLVINRHPPGTYFHLNLLFVIKGSDVETRPQDLGHQLVGVDIERFFGIGRNLKKGFSTQKGFPRLGPKMSRVAKPAILFQVNDATIFQPDFQGRIISIDLFYQRIFFGRLRDERVN